jgi:uncharacterized protein YggU (UPF0235/DUF167 family)
MRLEIHVRPNGSRTAVGGTHDGALIVRVVEPATAGRATAAALGAVADALGVPRRSVALVRGATSRRKIVEVTAGPEHGIEERIGRLRHASDL